MSYLFKPIEQAPRRSPHVNCGLWVTICQRRFFNYYKCSFWAGVLLVGEAVHVGEGKAYRRPLCTFPSIFLWTWNCLKDSVFFKNKGNKWKQKVLTKIKWENDHTGCFRSKWKNKGCIYHPTWGLFSHCFSAFFWSLVSAIRQVEIYKMHPY